MAAVSPFTAAHRSYVKSLYKRFLVNELNWVVRRDIWRRRALEIRAEFERNRNIQDPRSLSIILSKAEEYIAKTAHPDPYIVPGFPGGTKWERAVAPPMGPIYDHIHGEAYHPTKEVVEMVESTGQDVQPFLDFLKTKSGELDGISQYLHDRETGHVAGH
ncbi:hypothetical protein SISSUDRAFT_1055251 [Sistotremastrum suecicum HHB10207 ss-3]|uniref:NADH dehydrogenase [ubiquinone] 1 beta subcomplex subunit 9 n=1 Tax=Sistotremastrum suecicum HHB10207 ss-3 TaxID=1314776 RepID=A0A165XXY5_9AGAM|nr:hypothetical protein SISSUDRAFT_1055251 [Sistotremastrum suecicum HHB10207 ss-3]